MKLRVFLMVALFSLLLRTTTIAEAEDPSIVIAYPGSVQDKDLIEQKFSEIAEKKLGISVRLVVIPTNTYVTTISRMLAGGEQIDVMYAEKELFEDSYIKGRLTELTELIEKKGHKIVEAIGDDKLNACRMVNGNLFGIPNNRANAVGWDSYAFNQEILDQYGILPDEIQTYDDLENVFSYIHEQAPELCIVQSGANTMMTNRGFYDAEAMEPFGVMLEGNDEFQDLFSTESYMDALKEIRSWYEKGYMPYNPIEEVKSFLDKMQAGELLCYTTFYKPGIEYQEKILTGKEISVVQLGKTELPSENICRIQWVIPVTTASPETATEVLEFLFTDPEINNLMSYGIEGIHYEKKEHFLVNLNDENDNPFAAYSWRVPNQFLTEVWEGNNPDLWKNIDEFNASAFKKADYGFQFDLTNIYGKYRKLSDIYEKYRYVLENGMIDPVEGCHRMMEEMEENGLRDVINEKNRQYRVWNQKR